MSTPSALAVEEMRPRGARSATADLALHIQQQIEEHPYHALAIAAGVGFIVGSGLSKRATARLFATGLRVSLTSAIGPLLAEIVERMRSERTSRID